LDMDVRWNSTYLMLKHLMPYRFVFSAFINSQSGYAQQHWYIAEKVLEFLELFYDSTVALSGVYYPTSPLVLHHILEIATHLVNYENNNQFGDVVVPMKTKFLKYWKKYLCYILLYLFWTQGLRSEVCKMCLTCFLSVTISVTLLILLRLNLSCMHCMTSMNLDLVQLGQLGLHIHLA
jgi:hypothetical protein